MDENTISKLSLNEELRDIEDEDLRAEIMNTGLRGHIILDSNDTEFPTRSKLQIKYGNLIDDPVNNKTIISPKENIIVDKPIINVGEYTYNGEPQGPEIIGLTDDMIVQNATNINAGTYQLIISLKDAPIAFWSDSTTAPIIIEYTINRIIVRRPTIPELDREYTGYEIYPETQGFDENLMERWGDLVGVNPGSYTVYFDLKDKVNYEWHYYGTMSPVYDTWVIYKGTTTIDVNLESIHIDLSNLYSDIVITVSGSPYIPDVYFHDAEGNRTYTSDIYTLNKINDYEYRISANANCFDDEWTLYIVVGGNSYYNGKFKTIPLSCNTYQELNDTSWELISQVSTSGIASSIWNIGDRKEIILNGQIGDHLTINNENYYVYIIGFDHNKSIEGSGISFGCFIKKRKSGIQYYPYAISDSDYEWAGLTGVKCFNINHWPNASSSISTQAPISYGGWAACDMRYDILGSTNNQPDHYGEGRRENDSGYSADNDCATNPIPNTLMAALPSDLRAVMKPIFKYTDNGDTYLSSDDETLLKSVTGEFDFLPLMSFCELYGYDSSKYFNPYENNKQEQYQYYKNGNSMIKYTLNIAKSTSGTFERVKYWLRSKALQSRSDLPIWWYYFDSYNFNNGNGVIGGTQLNISFGLSPVFLV